MNRLVASMPQERGHGWPVKCLPMTSNKGIHTPSDAA
jgi:hypothetical protein